MIYVMSDIHGCAKAFLKMMKEISFTDKDELYILGDIVDRGPDFLTVFNYIQKHPNIHLLMGNHEKMMMEFINAENAKDMVDYRSIRHYWTRWASNGGEITYDQYHELDKEKQREVNDVFNSLLYYKIIEMNNKKYVLCHAGVIFNKDLDVKKCIEKNIKSEKIIWMRDLYLEHNYVPEPYVVIHGHTPVQYLFETNKITKYCNDKKIDIDCGCAYDDKLGCLRIDDMKEFYISVN